MYSRGPFQVATNKTDELRAGQGIWDVGKPLLELFFYVRSDSYLPAYLGTYRYAGGESGTPNIGTTGARTLRGPWDRLRLQHLGNCTWGLLWE